VRLQLLAAGGSEDAEDISEDDGPVNEVEEFMVMVGEDNEEAGDDTTIQPPMLELETVRVALDWRMSIAALKEIAAYLNLLGGAPKKETLFNRIRDSPHVTKISKTEFEY
jgi:hypothetical protein